MHRALNFKRFVVLMTVGLTQISRVSAQENGDLQQQLQQLKQQYEQTTKDLQQRISVLEQQIEKQNAAEAQEKQAAKTPNEATVSATELAAERAVRKVLFGGSDVGAQYQGQIPSV